MLTACLVDTEGNILRGGRELVQEWRQSPGSRIWIDLDDVTQSEEDAVMGLFGLHPLAVRDARRERHPPKLEVFDSHLFILLKGLDASSRSLEFGTLQLALFASEDFLITRHVKKSVSVNHWQQSPELAKMLSHGGVRLALEISTTAARRYLDLLLEFEPRLTELEDQLQEKPDDEAMRELTRYRTRLRKLRRDFNYHARLFDSLREEETAFFNASADEYRHQVMDVYEKYERLLSLCSMYYELAGDLVDGYISLSSHELNNTMRILTVLTAIFVPLGFLAGLYGMNFDHMPELHWHWGYYSLLAVMATIIVTLLAVFKFKRWL
ncbi:MAG: magnesium transporter CorA family protein [Porticoccaceae bacterium]